MKKTLLFLSFILVSAFMYSQTQPTVHNATFTKIAKNSGSDCSCSGWINKSVADQGESSTKDSNDVVKFDNVESDGVYQEVAVEANSNYTLDLEYWFSDATTTTQHIEVLILKGSGYVSGYTPAYAPPATAEQDGFGYDNLTAVDDTNNHVARTTITPPGNTDKNSMTQLTFNTGSETSIAIFIRAVGPYDAGSHGDSGKDKGWMNGATEVRIDNLVLVNTGAATATGNVVSPVTTALTNGYVNTFSVNDDSYQFGFAYGLADMKTTVTASSITLQPNFAIWNAEATNTAWFDNTSGTQTPVLYIEANSFVESTDLDGSALTFEGNVSSFDIDGAYTVKAFIKALNPNTGFSTDVNKTVTLSATGDFSVSATAAELVDGLIIQYGFSVTGVPADPANEGTLGSVVVGAKATASTTDVTIGDFNIYPNPTTNVLNISSDAAIDKVDVYNLLGQQVKTFDVNSNKIAFNVSDLESGIYLVKITSGSKQISKKFIKK